jgi:hypothetical protein
VQAHEQALAEQRADANRTFRAFVDALAVPLAEFIGEEATEEAVIAGATAARHAVEHNRAAIAELSKADSELSAIRSALGLPSERVIMPFISELTAKGNWEDWARRMHEIATGNFALAQTSEQIQAGLEEALLADQKQSGIARKLEMLRFQKRILVTGRVALRRGIQKPDLYSVIAVVIAVRRLNRLNGTGQ